MKLNEIRLLKSGIRHKRYSLTDFDPSTQQNAGYGEDGRIIVQMNSKKDKRVLLYALYESEEFLSGVVGYFYVWNGVRYFVILDAFTPEQHRRRGYATALYTALVRKYGFKLMSDKEQTEHGKMLWDGIRKVLNVQVLDAQEKKIVPLGQVSDEQIYITEPDRYLLVAESTGIDTIGIPGIGDGILTDCQNYTHPNNVGLYD